MFLTIPPPRIADDEHSGSTVSADEESTSHSDNADTDMDIPLLSTDPSWTLFSILSSAAMYITRMLRSTSRYARIVLLRIQYPHRRRRDSGTDEADGIELNRFHSSSSHSTSNPSANAGSAYESSSLPSDTLLPYDLGLFLLPPIPLHTVPSSQGHTPRPGSSIVKDSRTVAGDGGSDGGEELKEEVEKGGSTSVSESPSVRVDQIEHFFVAQNVMYEYHDIFGFKPFRVDTADVGQSQGEGGGRSDSEGEEGGEREVWEDIETGSGSGSGRGTDAANDDEEEVEDGEECVVCLTARREVLLLPCR
eukprot:gene1508-1747_t